MEVIVVPTAEAQIREVDSWWREHRTAAPELFVQELAAALALIGSRPRIGRRRRHATIPGLRRVLLRSTRYHLYYVPVDEHRIFVLAVWSAVRGRGPSMKRPE
ncbi:MAG TPA: type II toxin-antitoxin system RelE/ParE family toxin [Planctomycetota bacterium]|nr:type II toxin-antitoxin system RelE/ParE family toxin [Planctomycetota bacterium]